MTQDLVLTPTDFVAIANNALEIALGYCTVEGELANFRISKNKWVYFDLKDDYSKVSCFGTIYSLPGPIEDGMILRITGQPRLHPQFGFSVTVQNISLAGEGTIKKAYELLKSKLQSEGLFDLTRKRYLPYPPKEIALITSIESAAYADFIKILQARWPFVKVNIYDVLVQGENAPSQLSQAVHSANNSGDKSEVIVITRGGGSADDLSVFNDERVVRAIAGSRMPTLVAIGHEIDESLSELAADLRASTPSNAAELLVPDKAAEVANIISLGKVLAERASSLFGYEKAYLKQQKTLLSGELSKVLTEQKSKIMQYQNLLNAYNPNLVLKRGYTLVKTNNKLVFSIKSLKIGDDINVQFKDGTVRANVNKLIKE